MKKINIKLLTLLVFSLIFSSVFYGNKFDINANSGIDHDNVIKELTIVDKKDQYYGGETITLQGSWAIPDDSVELQYKPGDTFVMDLPEGLTPAFSTISLSGMATGVAKDGKVYFTFTEGIADKANRHGGFELIFTVDHIEEEGSHPVDIISTNNDGSPIIKDSIVVVTPEQGNITESDEAFAKGKQGQTTEGLKWYIRINKDGEITGSNVTIEDRLGDDHVIDLKTFRIMEHESYYDEINVTESLDVVFDADKKGFTIKDIPITGGVKGYRNYTIYYDTIYTGTETTGKVTLENSAKITTENQGVLYPDGSENQGLVVGDLIFGSSGWGIGDTLVSFRLKKIDSVTKLPLANASFKLSHKTNDAFEPITFVTDENGIYEHPQKIYNGLYILEEVEAPNGYKKIEPQQLRITADETEFEVVVENDLEPISILVSKSWVDQHGQESESFKDVAIALFANDKKIMQKILLKGETTLSFNNLQTYDEEGNTIKYHVEEVDVEGFTATISGSAEEGFHVVNQANVPPIIIDPEPETVSFTVEKKWVGTPLKEIDVELLQNGILVETVSLSTLNNWTYEFNSLDKYDEHGIDYVYTVEEKEIEGYYSTIGGSMSEGYIITNTEITTEPQDETITIPVSKTWIGEEKESITVNLFRNNEEIETLVLSKDNDWHGFFENLDKYDEFGNKIKYEITEVQVFGYESTIEGNESDGFKIVNKQENSNIIKPSIPEKPDGPTPTKVDIIKTPTTGIKSPSFVYFLVIGLSIACLTLTLSTKRKLKRQ